MWLTSVPGRPKLPSDLVALAVLLAVIAAATSCTDGSPQSQPADTDARILSAYYGLDELPPGATLLCGAMVAGEDGMPVVFSVQLDEDTVSPAAFAGDLKLLKTSPERSGFVFSSFKSPADASSTTHLAPRFRSKDSSTKAPRSSTAPLIRSRRRRQSNR